MKATKKPVRVAEYRDLIGAVGQWRVSLLSAVGSHERRIEAARLRNAVAELRAARCRTASDYDRQKAASAAADAESLLAQHQAEFDAADVNLSRMAFGAKWK